MTVLRIAVMELLNVPTKIGWNVIFLAACDSSRAPHEN